MNTSYSIPPMKALNKAFNWAWSGFPNVGRILEREDVRGEFLEVVCRRCSGRSGAPYDPERGELGAWLYFLARSTIFHSIQNLKRHSRGEVLFGLEEDACLMEVGSGEEDIVAKLSEFEDLTKLEAVLNRMPDREQLVLRKMDARRNRELGEAIQKLRTLIHG